MTMVSRSSFNDAMFKVLFCAREVRAESESGSLDHDHQHAYYVRDDDAIECIAHFRFSLLFLTNLVSGSRSNR